MASDDRTPPSTSNEHSTASTLNPTRPISSIFRNRFSNASLLSLSSFRTLLPQYTVVDTPASPLSEVTSPSTMEPPRYSLLQHRQSLMLTRTASTATGINVESDPEVREFRYSYSYPIRPKNPWATLHLHTRDAAPGDSISLQSQPRVPRVWSCDPVTGAVQLDLDSPQSIQHISITLNGNIVLSARSAGRIAFLKREFTVWDRSMDDAIHSDTNAKVFPKKNIDTRMVAGRHMFPFSFPFPKQTDPVLGATSVSPFRPRSVSITVESPSFDYDPKDRKKRQRGTSVSDEPSYSKKSHALDHPLGSDSMMPQTFMEKDIGPNIAYDISVRIVHGRFNTSSRIQTNLAYFPATEPLPMSEKRRQAYEAGALIPSPMDDPDGWFALPTVKTYGMVNIDGNSLHTRADCTLYIAQPLSYTRGSVIPCFITIYFESDDVEVAHLPSTDRPTARLVRHVWHPVINHDISPSFRDGGSSITWVETVVPISEQKMVTHVIGRAKWWTPSKGIVQSPNTRYLEGEIHLGPDLQPSCGFQSFQVEYAVELLTFQTANFTPELQQNGVNVAASKPVEIATLHRQDEPVPTPYSDLQPDTANSMYRIRLSLIHISTDHVTCGLQ